MPQYDMLIGDINPSVEWLGKTHVQCSCHWSVSSPDAEFAQRIYDDHECEWPPADPMPIPWHYAFFKFMSLLVWWTGVLAVLYLILEWTSY